MDRSRSELKRSPGKSPANAIRRVSSILPGIVFALLGVASTAHAHHSLASFDHVNSYRLEGRIGSFRWMNPHGYIDLEIDSVVVGPDHLSRVMIELPSIIALRRFGWKWSDFKNGDAVSVVVAPSLDGKPEALLLEIELPDGQTLYPPVPQIDSFNRDPTR